MGELLENFKGYDVQAARRKAREEGLTEGRKEGLQEGHKEGRKKERQEWIEKIMSLGQNYDNVEDFKRELLKEYLADEE